jgi:hypothetical protein
MYLDHLSGIYYFGLPAACPDMPVTTQSMMKRGLQTPPGSVGLLTCPTCCTDGAIDTSSSMTLQPLSALVSQVPELIDQCELSSSSSELDDSSSMPSNDSFEISKYLPMLLQRLLVIIQTLVILSRWIQTVTITRLPLSRWTMIKLIKMIL